MSVRLLVVGIESKPQDCQSSIFIIQIRSDENESEKCGERIRSSRDHEFWLSEYFFGINHRCFELLWCFYRPIVSEEGLKIFKFTVTISSLRFCCHVVVSSVLTNSIENSHTKLRVIATHASESSAAELTATR